LVKFELRRKLREVEQATESFAWLGILAPGTVLFSLAAILVVWLMFGYVAFLIIGGGYLLSMMSGMVVVVMMLKTRKSKEIKMQNQII